MIEKRENGVAIHDQPFAFAGMRHVRKLMRRDIEQLGEDRAVARSLIQQQDEVAVFKDVLGLLRVEQILHVLRDCRRNTAPFAETLPDLRTVGRCNLVLEQQMEFVDIVPRRLLPRAVGRHAPPHMILNHVHGQRLELGTGLLGVEAYQTVAHVHVRAMIEQVERAVHVRVDSLCHVVRILVPMACGRVPNHDQGGVQFRQGRHIVRARVFEVAGVHYARGFLDDGFLAEGEHAGADNDLEHGHEKVDLERDRIVAVAVVGMDVHGVDVFGAGRRNPDHLTVQFRHERRVFALGIAHDHVVAGQDEHDEHLPLGRERFAAAGRAEDQPVGIFEQLAVHHDQVVAQRVDAVIERLRPALAEFLRHEWHENRRRAGRQRPLDRHEVIAERQGRHQALLLLKVQPDERAVVLLRDARGLKRVVLQLLFGLAGVDDQERHQEHPLVPALQFLEQALGFASVSRKVGRDDVHIVSRTHRLFLLLDLHSVEVGDLAFDRFDGLVLVDGPDVHADDQAALHVQKVRQHAVVQLGREDA